jgi:hypothetical protein
MTGSSGTGSILGAIVGSGFSPKLTRVVPGPAVSTSPVSVARDAGARVEQLEQDEGPCD